MSLSFSMPQAKQHFENHYDVVIVGAGPAGLTAAIYAKRKGLSTLVVGEKIGGQIKDTTTVENYTGFEVITGEGLAHEFQKHVESLNVPIMEYVRVERLEDLGPVKKLHLDDGKVVEAKAVILATGSKSKKLEVPGEDAYYGRGVTYCAICDGPLFQDRRVIVAGGGNSAIEAAVDLAKIAEHVTVVHRSQLRADQIVIDQLKKFENVTVLLETQILEIQGERMVKGVKALDKKSGQEVFVEGNGVFIEIGYTPNSEWLQGVVALNARGEVEVNTHGETNVPGIYAAGDLTQVPYKQVVVAVGEGAKAALSANDYINRLS